MNKRWIYAMVAMLAVGLFFAIVSAVEGMSANPMHLMTYAITTLYAGVAVDRLADQPREFLELDKLFIVVVGCYVVLPLLVATFFPGIGFDEYLQAPVMWCSLAAVVGFGVGFTIAPTRLLKGMLPQRDFPWMEGESAGWGIAIILIGLVLLVLLVRQVGMTTYLDADYVDSYNAENGLGYLAAGWYLLEVGLFTYFLARSSKGKRPILPLILYGLLVVLSMRVGRRRMTLEGGLGILALQHFSVKPIRAKTLIVALAIVVPLFTVLGQARSALSEGWQGMKTYAFYEFDADQWVHVLDDFHTVPLSLATTTNFIPEREPYRFGKTYLQAFEILIPQKLFPDRPLTPAQWAVWTSEESFAAAGGGRSFSLIAEAYMNFSYIGVFLFCMFQAAMVKTVVEYRRDFPTSASRLLLYVCATITVLMMVRGDFADWLKMLVVLLAAAVPAAMWLGAYRPDRRSVAWGKDAAPLLGRAK